MADASHLPITDLQTSVTGLECKIHRMRHSLCYLDLVAIAETVDMLMSHPLFQSQSSILIDGSHRNISDVCHMTYARFKITYLSCVKKYVTDSRTHRAIAGTVIDIPMPPAGPSNTTHLKAPSTKWKPVSTSSCGSADWVASS